MAYESVNCIEANARIVGKVLLCFSGERQENFEPAGEGKELPVCQKVSLLTHRLFLRNGISAEI